MPPSCTTFIETKLSVHSKHSLGAACRQKEHYGRKVHEKPFKPRGQACMAMKVVQYNKEE